MMDGFILKLDTPRQTTQKVVVLRNCLNYVYFYRMATATESAKTEVKVSCFLQCPIISVPRHGQKIVVTIIVKYFFSYKIIKLKHSFWCLNVFKKRIVYGCRKIIMQ